MDLLQALILGLVEGITEYLPVSSTGHLLIAQRLLGIPESAASNGYAIAIQAGAILAVLGLYRTRVTSMVRGVFGQDGTGLKLALCIVVAFLPAAVLGLLFDDRIEQYLFGVKPVIAAWVVGGVVILALTKWTRARREGARHRLRAMPCDVARHQPQPGHHPGGTGRGAVDGGGRGVRVPARCAHAHGGHGLRGIEKW
jgi:undecaprenyl pyrophosphate phosphatase UppP